jgi:septal ring factor EnvC (AmiA/AmiB activator)
MTLEPFVIPALSLIGGGLGAYVGMRAAIVRLETQMADVRTEIERLRERCDELIQDLVRLAGRVEHLEDRRQLRESRLEKHRS